MWYGLKIGNFRRLAAVSVTIGTWYPVVWEKKWMGGFFVVPK